MSILVEEQLEIVVTTKKYGLIVLEAQYDNSSLHWEWLINGVDTGYKIMRHEADRVVREDKQVSKTVLKEMIKEIRTLRDSLGSVESKQIRHTPFKNRYSIELIKRLAIDVYPELVI
jgi:hypothetical protein